MKKRLRSIRKRSWARLTGLGVLGALLFSTCDLRDRVVPFEESDSLIVAIRVSPLSFSVEADERTLAFEQALLEKLAAHVGKKARFIPLRSQQEVIDHLRRGKAHLAAGWLSPQSDPRLASTPPFHFDDIVLVQNDATLPIRDLEGLSDKTVHIPSGSRAANVLNEIRSEQAPSLQIAERPDGSGVGLLEAIGDQRIEYAAMPRQQFLIAQNYFPELQSSLVLRPAQPIVWLVRAEDAPVPERIRDFLQTIETDGTLHALKDIHFSFRHRLTRLDAIDFIARIASTLPNYHATFKDAQIRTGIDWRLIASLSYQESQWNPLATSFTNVRGMMMLTEDTADRLHVSNRLDPVESIHAGARYLAMLRDELPNSVQEPDRTWLALAAYNIGMGHMRGARAIARSRNADPDNWYEMKKVLPLLARPEFYERLKSGRARGGEAVILVENIRAFYDILSRHQPPYYPLRTPTKNAEPQTLRAYPARQ